MFSFLGPVLGPLERACPGHLGLSSIACGLALGVFIRPCTNGVALPRRIASVAPPIKTQTTLSQRAPCIGYLEGWLVYAVLIPPQPASNPIGKWKLHHTKKKKKNCCRSYSRITVILQIVSIPSNSPRGIKSKIVVGDVTFFYDYNNEIFDDRLILKLGTTVPRNHLCNAKCLGCTCEPCFRNKCRVNRVIE